MKVLSSGDEVRTTDNCELAEMFAEIAGAHQWVSGLVPGWSVCWACERVAVCPECLRDRGFPQVKGARIRRCIQHIGECVRAGYPRNWPELLR